MVSTAQQVWVEHADAHGARGDAFVVPSTTDGRFGQPWADLVREWGVQSPPGRIPLGDLHFSALGDSAPFRFVVFAASVVEGGTSSSAVVTKLGSALGSLTRSQSIEHLVSPALGAGVGGLDPADAVLALARGFVESAEPRATLQIIEIDSASADLMIQALDRWSSGESEADPELRDRDVPSSGRELPSWGSLSENARAAMRSAEAYRVEGGSSRLHMEHLVAGVAAVAEGGQKVTDLLGPGLLDIVLDVARHVTNAELPPSVRPSPIRALPRMSGHAEEALRAASRIGPEAEPLRLVDILDGALTVDCSFVRALAARTGVGGDALADPTPDTVPDHGLLAADQLGLEREVKMLSSLVLARDTSPPLAIGLHGDWGSGKSFFMAMMREQVAELADAAKQDEKVAEVFCPEIRQICFNAWHYADGNLWASLAATIFDGLAESPVEVRRQKTDQLSRASRDVVAAREVVAQANDELRQAQLAAGTMTNIVRSSVPEVISAIAGVEHLEDRLDAYGEGRAVGHDVDEFASVVRETQSVWERLTLTTWMTRAEFRRDRRRPTLIGLAVLVIAAAVTLGLSRSALWSSVLGVAGGVLAAALTALSGARQILNMVRGANRRREKPVRAAEVKLAAAEENERRASAEYVERRKDLERLQDRGHHLYDLVRTASSEYQKELGTVSRLRKDFELLVGLLGPVVTSGQQVADPESEPGRPVSNAEQAMGANIDEGPYADGQGSLRVDRIVLYIDDLDRCPADVVVEVLRAVNLLLAFDLFMVVVAVDGRWLEAALHARYQDLLQEPREYLEKIIQLPFVLRPSANDGIEKLINKLTLARVRTDGPGDRRGPGSTADAPDLGSTAGRASDSADPADSGSSTGPASDAFGGSGSGSTADSATDGSAGTPSRLPQPAVRPAAVQFTPEERELLADLGVVISTPRMAKRLVNTYRMLRVGLDGKERGTFLPASEGGAGQFQVVSLLLATLIGCPLESEAVFAGLRGAPDGEDFWTIVDGLDQDGVPGKDMTRLLALRVPLPSARVDECRVWLPHVTRFAYTPPSRTAPDARTG